MFYGETVNPTLTITMSVELKRSGFDAGSKMVPEDWKDRSRPSMLRDSAKLFRNKT